MNKIYTFVFMGISGSGKGTQINLLKEYLNKIDSSIEFYPFVMGGVFRNLMKDKGYVQDTIKEITSKGLLVPDIVTNSLFASDLFYHFKPEQHLSFDGIPRSIRQAETVIEILKFYNRIDPVIINIKIGEEEAKKRMLSRARPDDTEEAIVERFNFYRDNVVPATEFLKEKSGFKYIEIDGERSIDEIHKDLIKFLNL